MRMDSGRGPRKSEDPDAFSDCLRAYRDELGDPDFASGLLHEEGSTADLASRLTQLHAMAAERFEEMAGRFAAKAEQADAYERGAYTDPPLSGAMLTALMTTTLAFAIVVLLRIPIVGAILLVVMLGLNAIFVMLWRRPPYRYEAEFRKTWDAAANIASERAERAKAASLSVGTESRVEPRPMHPET